MECPTGSCARWPLVYFPRWNRAVALSPMPPSPTSTPRVVTSAPAPFLSARVTSPGRRRSPATPDTLERLSIALSLSWELSSSSARLRRKEGAKGLTQFVVTAGDEADVTFGGEPANHRTGNLLP